jgi:hypothetical protein
MWPMLLVKLSKVESILSEFSIVPIGFAHHIDSALVLAAAALVKASLEKLACFWSNYCLFFFFFFFFFGEIDSR